MRNNDSHALLNARTTFQRASDAKLFTGWVRSFSSDTVMIESFSATLPDEGDLFSFQVHGYTVDATFFASLTSCLPADLGPFTPIKPRNGVMLELNCKIASEMAFRPSKEEARFWTDNVSGRAFGNDVPDIQRVLDIGPSSFCILTNEPMKRGQILSVTLSTEDRLIQCEAEVRNCIGKEECYRIGLKILSMPRLDAAWWRQFYDTIVDANKVHGLSARHRAA